MIDKLQFKISSALKDIIGRDLINDDLIAIFELVKNSYDAYATRVDIYFDNLYGDNPTIKIVDNGKGMSLEDIKSKWLFLAYSAKKDGSEDKEVNFRDKINVKRAYAGAKGIGRFSCDRLGTKLMIETTKQGYSTQVLEVDWEKFEEDSKKEFINIDVEHHELEQRNISGTTLTIKNLRGQWDRKKLLKLKDALAKLINPKQNTEDKFEIYLHAKDEEKEDKKQKDYRNKVNGAIENKIFEILDLKTSKIVTKIFTRNNENIIQTSLYEGNELVYEIEEASEFKHLKEIEYTIYFLNQSAKSTFKRRMGIESVGYGHIFVYKNGIRIYPYGERGEDPLGMDVRKGQGYARYLGTREVIGFINIGSATKDLKETSSRGDGLVKNEAYEELKELFYNTLKRLEKYTINIINWGHELNNDYINLDDHDKFNAMVDLIKKLTNPDEIISINYGDKLLAKLQEKEQSSATGILKSVKADLINGNLDPSNIVKKINDVELKVKKLQQATQEVEQEAELLKKENKRKEKQILFFQSSRTLTEDELVNLQHHIGINAEIINGAITRFRRQMDKKTTLTKEEVVDILDEISIANQRVLAINKYATKADFLTNSESIKKDLIAFIEQYIENIHKVITNSKIDIKIENSIEEFEIEFKPMEITIIVDNLISNSRKAKARKLTIKFEKISNHLNIFFIDDGVGLDKDIIDSNKIFEKGFTTTKGSGLGLYHVKELIESIGGSIEAINNPKRGLTIKIGLKQ